MVNTREAIPVNGFTEAWADLGQSGLGVEGIHTMAEINSRRDWFNIAFAVFTYGLALIVILLGILLHVIFFPLLGACALLLMILSGRISKWVWRKFE